MWFDWCEFALIWLPMGFGGLFAGFAVLVGGYWLASGCGFGCFCLVVCVFV